MLGRGWRQLRHTEGALRWLLWWVYGPAGHGSMGGKEAIKNSNSLVQPWGLEWSCDHTPTANPQLLFQVCSGMLCIPLTTLWQNSCISPVSACLETLEINDQKKESIWEIKALY